jgi:hypothetical protein
MEWAITRRRACPLEDPLSLAPRLASGCSQHTGGRTFCRSPVPIGGPVSYSLAPTAQGARTLQGKRLFLARGALTVVVAWLTLVAIILGLQALGRNFGFNVWWGGETRNWVSILQDGPGSAAARLFWQLDSRNPLSPWWYIPFRDFILNTRSAFLVLHLGTSLLLGVASYLAVVGVTHGRGRLFGVSLGVLAAVFLTSTKIDSIHWNFIGALACSLLSVWAFAEFLNSERSKPAWLVWSVVLWLVAVQTYTIQSGAMLAVGFLSFTQEGRFYGGKHLAKRVLRAVLDMLPYAVTLLMFVLVWRTSTSTAITETTNSPDPNLMLQSLAQGIWHQSIAHYAVWARQLGPGVTVGVLVTAIPLLTLTQMFVSGGVVVDGTPIQVTDLGRVFLVGVCLVIPTVVLESTSTWFPPGTRWIMVLQFWLPLLLLSALALVVIFLPGHVVRLWTWRFATAALAAGAILLTLAWNQVLVHVTAGERAFMTELERIVTEDKIAGAEFPRHYLVRLASGGSVPSDWVSRAYTKTEFGEFGLTTFRYLSTPSPFQVKFHPDHVENPESARPGTTPYSRVGILAWNGTRLTRTPRADRAAFDGLPVEWKRSDPLP